MRTASIGCGIRLSLALAATIAMAACTSGKPPNSTTPGTSHASPSAASRSHAASPPAATPSSTPGGVQNLVVSSAERNELTAAYAAAYASVLRIPVSELGSPAAAPGSVYYAYDPSTDTYWAMARFEPTAPFSDQTAYMDGTSTGMFKKVGAGGWQVMIPINPDICEELQFFPQTVLRAWALPSATPPGVTC